MSIARTPDILDSNQKHRVAVVNAHITAAGPQAEMGRPKKNTVNLLSQWLLLQIST